MLSVTVAVVVSIVGFTLHHLVILGMYFGYTDPLTWASTLGVVIDGISSTKDFAYPVQAVAYFAHFVEKSSLPQ